MIKNPKLPGAKLIPEVKQITSEMISSAKDKGSEFASGGMITKLERLLSQRSTAYRL